MLELDCRRIQVTYVTVNCAIRQAASSRAAADQVPVFWSLDFNWTVLYIQGVTGGTDQSSGECSLC